VAQRLIERERALADDGTPTALVDVRQEARRRRRRRRVRAMRAFVLGLLVGAAALIAAALILGP
jgi:hypothetical protein